MNPSEGRGGRLEREHNIWLATVRPDGRPHLVPIWFVVDEGCWYICTAPESVKARNLQANPRVVVALEDGDNPFVVEGMARAVSPPPAVVRKFKEKFDWDITTDADYSAVFEISVTRQVLGMTDDGEA
jgi:PPOX class probable F420-dependent enzyme